VTGTIRQAAHNASGGVIGAFIRTAQ